MERVGVVLAVVIGLTTLVSFFIVARDKRRAVVLAMLPLSVVPMAASWLASEWHIIQGFRRMALDARGGVGAVLEVLSAAAHSGFNGSAATLAALVVGFVLLLVTTRVESTAPPAPLRSIFLLFGALLSMVTATIAAQLGSDLLPLPLAVIAPVDEFDELETPMTLAAVERLGLADEAELGAASLAISNAMTTAATTAFGALALCFVSCALGWMFAFTAVMARWTTAAGLILTLLIGLGVVVQLRNLDAFGTELAHVSSGATTP